MKYVRHCLVTAGNGLKAGLKKVLYSRLPLYHFYELHLLIIIRAGGQFLPHVANTFRSMLFLSLAVVFIYWLEFFAQFVE